MTIFKKTLKVKAVEGKLQPRFDAFDSGIMRFVGCKFDPELPGFVASGIEEIPYQAEYVKAVKEGDLEAADEETAKLCGIKFNKQLVEKK